MADQKITEISVGVPVSTDLIPYVSDPSGSAVTKASLVSDIGGSGGGTGYNYLINGGFDFSQRTTPGTLTTIADKDFGADRWWITRENADVQYKRFDALGESGLTSKYYGQLKKITNTGKIFSCQAIEGVNSVPLRSKVVIFQIKMKASASKTIRMGIFELQNAGTLDAIPATLVTAFGANSTDPTMGANVAVITAAASKSVTTSWQSFSVSVTVPSNSKNLICAFWTDSQFAANDTLEFAEAGLFVGSTVQDWTPRLTLVELQLCQRYYWKTFSLDTAPVQNLGSNTGEFHGPAPAVGAAAQRIPKVIFPVTMFAAPTLITYNPGAANAEVRDINVPGDCSSTLTGNISVIGSNISCVGNATTAIGNALRVHISAEAELL